MGYNTHIILSNAKVPLDAIGPPNSIENTTTSIKILFSPIKSSFEGEKRVIRSVEVPVTAMADDQGAVAKGVSPARACNENKGVETRAEEQPRSPVIVCCQG